MSASLAGAAPVLIGVATVLFVIATIAGLARFARRRERAVRREKLTAFSAALELTARGVWSGRDLGVVATGVDAAVFWTAIENASMERRLSPRIVRGLAHSRHVADERRMLRDDSPWRRQLAARRLGLISLQAARRALRRALVRGPEAVTHEAALALAHHRDGGALRWLILHPQALAHRTPRARFELLRAFGRRAHPLLLEELRRGIVDPARERAVIDVLGAGRHREAAPAIAARLSHPEVELRVAAARALGRLGERTTAAVLIAALGDPEWAVRAQVARALGACGGAESITPLGARLEDPAWWVRRHAAYALAGLGSAGRAELARIAAQSRDRYAREMADEALAAG